MPDLRLVLARTHYALATPIHLRGVDAHVLGRLDLQAAVPVRAVIYANIMAGQRQMPVGALLPIQPNIAQLIVRRGQAQRRELLVLKLPLGFLAKPVLLHLPRGQHDVGMMVANVGVGVRPVDGEIHRHPVAVGQPLRELARQLQPLLRRQFVR